MAGETLLLAAGWPQAIIGHSDTAPCRYHHHPYDLHPFVDHLQRSTFLQQDRSSDLRHHRYRQ
jgi:hypothetical protein